MSPYCCKRSCRLGLSAPAVPNRMYAATLGACRPNRAIRDAFWHHVNFPKELGTLDRMSSFSSYDHWITEPRTYSMWKIARQRDKSFFLKAKWCDRSARGMSSQGKESTFCVFILYSKISPYFIIFYYCHCSLSITSVESGF